MKIYRVIANKIPTNCIECPLMQKKLCGKDNVVHPTSGSAFIERIPDNRCVIKEGR